MLRGHRQKLDPISGPPELENRPRYRKEFVENNDPLQVIRKTLAEDGKVLWVCNTVGRVMAAAHSVHDLAALIYHSRFKYEDRVQRHEAVIEAFNRNDAALAVCSQELRSASICPRICSLPISRLCPLSFKGSVDLIGAPRKTPRPSHS